MPSLATDNPVTAVSLSNGVKLLAGSQHRRDGSLACSDGMTSGPQQYPSLPYCAHAFVPKLPWREPTDAELDILLGGASDIQPGNWVQVIRVPQPIMDAFEPLRAFARGVSEERQLEPLRATSEYKEGLARALEYARTLTLPHTVVEKPCIYFNEPGLPTTSNTGANHDQLLGIHTDSLGNDPLPLRKFSLNRICLNTGSGDRFLLYVNLGLEQIAALLRERNISVGQNPLSPPLEPFRRAFMSTYAAYPVVKLRLRPGEGYLAPTENVIHDGCTEGQQAFDIIFMAHGHFRPQLGEMPDGR